ncbi:hypothetical protein GOP47_0014959 [Adiantum capillus-veneris]|uniref:Ubiquinol oxidase n=1 Tax=Adiantum capillus-veneris TaxID=13818 RepID=A0A9D4ZFA5_ADICA|nr:hypothetical protein GOP47_0014959 [Adiantum capillus-veneris]
MNTVAGNSRRKVALAVLAIRRAAYSTCIPASGRVIDHPSLLLTERAWSGSRMDAAPTANRLLRPAQPARHLSVAAPGKQDQQAAQADDTSVAGSRSLKADQLVSEYWGIVPKQLQREDGSPWPWHSFRPADTYAADVAIDVDRHYPAEKSWVDRAAFWTVRALRGPVDLFFKERHVSHALLLETVAGVPGMVGGMLLHLRSLRRFEHSGGWIKTLLDEAENERMHLMTWVEVLRPAWWERALVLAVQGTFFNAYFLLYLASPRLAHRFVGYLEEEAVRSYTEFLQAIDVGHTPNRPAPLIAIDYWRLPADATIRDVVLVVRADEAHHRDVNHFAADVYNEKRELRTSPAPISYH